jgi:hypothetical protein
MPSRSKLEYDRNSYWNSSAVDDVVGTSSDTTFILTPSTNAYGDNVITTVDQSSRQIGIGTRVNFRPNTTSGAGPITLRFSYDNSIAVGTYPNIIPDGTIVDDNGNDLVEKTLIFNRLTEVVWNGSHWVIQSHDRMINKLDSIVVPVCNDLNNGTSGEQYNLESVSRSIPFSEYVDGMVVETYLEESNVGGGVETVNIDGLGYKPLRNVQAGNLNAGDIKSLQSYRLRYFSSGDIFRIVAGNITNANWAGVARTASTGEVNAGTSTNTMITPANLKAAFEAGESSNFTRSTGHFRFSTSLGGFIVQWGEVSGSGPSVINVTFDISFPTAVMGVVINGYSISSSGTGDNQLFINQNSLSNSGFSTSGGAGVQEGIFYIAVGH